MVKCYTAFAADSSVQQIRDEAILFLIDQLCDCDIVDAIQNKEIIKCIDTFSMSTQYQENTEVQSLVTKIQSTIERNLQFLKTECKV